MLARQHDNLTSGRRIGRGEVKEIHSVENLKGKALNVQDSGIMKIS
jgi:hypothetical protein